jgi:CRP/FNR family cyclic AMP-dependent transcriptional regulator
MRVQTEMELLRSLPVFAGVDPAQLQILSFSSKRRKFTPGQPILLKGEVSRGAFLITSGRAGVYGGADATSPKLSSVETGTLVGELALFVATPNPVSIIAAQNVEAQEISRDLFKRVTEEFPEFGQQVFAALSQKLDQGLADLDELQKAFD